MQRIIRSMSVRELVAEELKAGNLVILLYKGALYRICKGSGILLHMNDVFTAQSWFLNADGSAKFYLFKDVADFVKKLPDGIKDCEIKDSELHFNDLYKLCADSAARVGAVSADGSKFLLKRFENTIHAHSLNGALVNVHTHMKTITPDFGDRLFLFDNEFEFWAWMHGKEKK